MDLLDASFDVGAYVFEFRTGPDRHDERQRIVGRKARRTLVVANVLLDVFRLEAAVVAVVVRRKWWDRVVLRRLDFFCHQRMDAIRPDDDFCALLDAAGAAAAFDACDPISVPKEVLDDKAFTQFCATLDRCIDQELVEHRASRAEPARPAFASRTPPLSANGPTSNVMFNPIGGQLVAASLESSPQRSRISAPCGQMTCVEIVSLGKVDLSTSRTR